MNYAIRHVLKAVILAVARQRELALPEPTGIVLPSTAEFLGMTRFYGLPVVLVDTETPGLIVPLEIS